MRLFADDLFVTHTLRDPQAPDVVKAGRWGQDVPSRPEPPRRPERVLGAQDNQKGHIWSVSVGGKVLAGFDHYHVTTVNDPTLGAGTRVTVWNDDPDDWPVGTRFAEVWDWYAPGPDPSFGAGGSESLQALVTKMAGDNAEARTRLLAWVADPAHWPINTRWRVTIYAEDPARLSINDVSADGVPFAKRPWTDFVPPPANETRHGTWVSDQAVVAHQQVLTQHQQAIGWRDYSAHLSSSETDAVTGRILAQRATGRYLPNASTITWYWQSTDRAVGYAVVQNEKALERTAGSGSITANLAGNANVSLATLTTPANDPNQATWPSGTNTYRVQVDISSIGTCRVVCGPETSINETRYHRVTSDLSATVSTSLMEVATSSDWSTTGVGIREVDSWTPGGSTASDRVSVELWGLNTDMMTASSVVFTCDADAFVDGPWEVSNDLSRAVQDVITVADVLSKAVVHLGTRRSDSLTVADVLNKAVVHLGVRPSDSITTSDLLQAVVHLGVRPADSITTSELARAVVHLGVRPFDAVVVAEVLQAVLPQLVVRPFETVTLAEVVTAAIQLGVVNVDSISVAELAKAVVPLIVLQGDSISVAELAKAALQLGVRPSDSISVVELTRVVQHLGVRPADSLTVADVANAAIQLGIVSADDISIVDVVHIALHLGMRLSDTLTVLDALRVGVNLGVRPFEAVTAAENWNAPLTPLIARLNEALAVLEDLRVQFPTLVAYPAENIAALDHLLAQLQVVRLTVLAHETVGVSEDVQLMVSVLLRAVADSLTVTESVLAELTEDEIRRSIDESISVVVFAKVVLDKLTVRPGESVTVTDLLQVAFDVLLVPAFDQVSVADVLRVVLPQLGVHGDDAVAVEDVLTAVLTPSAIQLAEQVGIAEYLNAALAPFLARPFESITVNELVTAALSPLLASPTESLTVAEMLKAVVSPNAARVHDVVGVQEALQVALNRFVAKPFDTVTVADVVAVFFFEEELKARPAEVIAIADAVLLAATALAKPFETLSIADVVTSVLTPGLKTVADLVAVTELAKVVLTPFFTRQADEVTVAELVKTVLTPLATHPADLVVATDLVLAFLTPLAPRSIETVTVAEFVKPLIPVLSVRPVEALTVGEALQAALSPSLFSAFDVILVQEYLEAALLLTNVRSVEVFDTVTVSDQVTLAFLAIIHFVTGDLRVEGSRSHLQGTLSGRVGLGSLLRGPSLTGSLRNLNLVSPAARLGDLLAVVDRAMAQLVAAL